MVVAQLGIFLLTLEICSYLCLHTVNLQEKHNFIVV